MSKRIRAAILHAAGLLLLLLSCRAALAAAPQVVTIAGHPLTVYIGDDASLQTINDQVPGTGQFYPDDSAPNTADAGWFIAVGSTLFGPNFAEHPADTATGSLGAETPYTPISISAVTGNGSAGSPFQVTVVDDAGSTGLRSTWQLSYVNGDGYATESFTVKNNGDAAQTVKIFKGGDIYLAGSDAGIPYRQAQSNSVGGEGGLACGDGSEDNYFVLIVPQVAPDHYTADEYSTVWSQIGGLQLNDAVLPSESCLDNGAALQWNRTIAAHGSISLQTAVSFGDIPSFAQFNVTAVSPASGAQGTSVNVTLTGIGFDANTSFASGFGDGITVGNVHIVNGTTATATLQISSTAALGPRNVVGTEHSDSGDLTGTLANGFTVTAAGMPMPGTLAFATGSYSVNEDAGHVTISVTRTGGSDGAVSVQYATADGSAQAPGDYTAASGTLNWADGDAGTKTISVPIIDDALVEGDESFTLNLSNVGGTTLGAPATTTVTIHDNDSNSGGGGDGGNGGNNGGGSGHGGKLKSGAGGIGSSLLAGLLLLAVLRHRRRFAALLTAAALLAASGSAAAAGNWYAGTRLGITHTSVSDGDLSHALSQHGNTVNADLDRNDFGGALYIGYHLLPRADIEVGYLRLGEYDADLDGTVVDGHALVKDAARELQGNSDALLANLRWRIPLIGALDFAPRLGGFVWHGRTEVSTDSGHYHHSRDGVGLEVGLGFDFTIVDGLRLGAGSELLRGSSHPAQFLHALEIEYDF